MAHETSVRRPRIAPPPACFARRAWSLALVVAASWVWALGAGCARADTAAGRDGVLLPSAEPWSRALEIGFADGGLDYAALAADSEDLDLYLASLRDARPEEAGRAGRIAFYSNAYNAVVARFVLDRYPEIESVRDVEGFFDELTFPIAGTELTLDEIETRARDEGDARVHFAVVCASHSCPDLRFEPYRAADLERQLEEQTRAFLSDSGKGLRYDQQRNELWLSSIFKWYAGDFTGGSTVVAFFARGKVLDWVLAELPADLADTLRRAGPSVRYLDYDWSLNDR